MTVAVDLILVLIVLFCALFGYRKGFILSCFNFLGGLISFVLGALFARPLGAYISNSFLKPLIANYFSKQFSDFFAERAAATGNSEVLSSAITFFRDLGLDQATLQKYFENAENNIERFIDSAVSAVTQPIAESIGYAIALILLFIVFFFLCRFIFKFFDLVAKLPVLNFANRSLGFLFGVSYGILLSVVFSASLIVLEPFLQNSDLPFLSGFSIDKTYITRFLSVFLKDFF